MSATARARGCGQRGLTFVIFVTHWDRFDDLVFDDLPRSGGFSPSVSEELHIGSTGGV
jgi:hypothetical protein